VLNPSNIRNRNLRRLLRKAELPSIRFHDLKHTSATLLLSKNLHPKIAQKMLGHASVAIIQDTYSHGLPRMGD
jgi:integrase